MPRSPLRGAVRALGAALALAASPGAAWAGTFVAVSVSGSGHFPSAGPSSIGNEEQRSDAYALGQTPGTAASGAISNGANGTDANGTIGAMSYQANAAAAPGALHAYGASNASSTAQSFPHADAASFAEARFWSTVRLYDPTYALGATISATLSMGLDWAPALSSAGGTTNVRSTVYANVTLDTLSLTATGDAPTSGYAASVDAPATGSFVNGSYYDVFGMLQVLTQSSVFGSSADPVGASAVSDAANTLHLYISGASTLTAIGEEGTNYAPVPEPGSAALLAIGVAALLRRRRAA